MRPGISNIQATELSLCQPLFLCWSFCLVPGQQLLAQTATTQGYLDVLLHKQFKLRLGLGGHGDVFMSGRRFCATRGFYTTVEQFPWAGGILDLEFSFPVQRKCIKSQKSCSTAVYTNATQRNKEIKEIEEHMLLGWTLIQKPPQEKINLCLGLLPKHKNLGKAVNSNQVQITIGCKNSKKQERSTAILNWLPRFIIQLAAQVYNQGRSPSLTQWVPSPSAGVSNKTKHSKKTV